MFGIYKMDHQTSGKAPMCKKKRKSKLDISPKTLSLPDPNVILNNLLH